MANQKLFRTFSNELINVINLKTNRSYYYYDDEGQKCELVENKVDPLASNDLFVKVEDNNRNWVKFRKNRSLYLNLSIHFESIANIFHGEMQACDSKTKLAIGLCWKATESKFKYCVKLGSFDDYMDEFEATISDIEIRCPDSNIKFDWFIYLEKNIDDAKQQGFADSEGMIVAYEHAWTIVTSGNKSLFPIEEYSKQGDPLWHIRVSYEAWDEDEFNLDNLAVVLNPAHPLFPKINIDSEEYDEMILKEVLSSALASLILEILVVAKDKGVDGDLDKKPFEANGSILSAMRYFKNVLKFSINSNINELTTSIKVFFDKEKKICK